MAAAIDILEERVAAAVDAIAVLRERNASLESELERLRAAAAAPTDRPEPAAPLLEELERLRAERLLIRERVRGLIREIDRVSW